MFVFCGITLLLLRTDQILSARNYFVGSPLRIKPGIWDKQSIAKHSKAKLSIQKCTEVYSNSVALWPLKVNMGMTPNIKFVPYLQSQDCSIWVEHGRTQRTFRGLQLLELH